ncbi:trehalose-phosphatase [Sphingomonas aerophila]|uniref:Trehalose 6-phosphate phosphatase n=1 Tax=Sphingomonas aerophila TaxID=1344948 RepID=A0A7W9BGA5_9SPHN|nr:trehalose 6-phosphate phosphatase [Sphingomonas aerophila]
MEETDPGVAEQLPAPPEELLRESSLFLDFDGTLVAIAEQPDAVIVEEVLKSLLPRLLVSLQGRVAIISGRALGEIDRLLVGGRFAASGSHGLEVRFPDGRLITPATPAALSEVVADMRALKRATPGLVVEEKPFGAALHYRTAPAAEEACRALATKLAERDGLTLQPGKMVFEIKVAGEDKGTALRALMADPVMAAGRPIFIGDDHTDEVAFEAAATMGGTGILVGPARPTAARYRLVDVPATLEWLQRAQKALA